MYITQQSGRRPKNITNSIQLPFSLSDEDIFHNMNADIPVIDTRRFSKSGCTNAQYQNDIFQICKCILPLRLAYLTKCWHMFCTQWVHSSKLKSPNLCQALLTETKLHTKMYAVLTCKLYPQYVICQWPVMSVRRQTHWSLCQSTSVTKRQHHS